MALISSEFMHGTEAAGHARPVPVFQSAQLAILQLPGTAFGTEVLVLCCRLSTDVDRFIVRRAVKADITGMCRVADACAASWSAQQLKVSSPLRCSLNCLLRIWNAHHHQLQHRFMAPPVYCTRCCSAPPQCLSSLCYTHDCCACQALDSAGGEQHQLCSIIFSVQGAA